MDSNETNFKEWLLKDEKEISSEDLFQTFTEDVFTDAEDTTNTVEKIASVWVQMGLSSKEMVERIKPIKEYHMDVNREFLKTEQTLCDRLIQYNKTKMEEINAIQSDLGLPPFVTPNDLPLKQIARILEHKYNQLIEVMTERVKRFTELQSKKDNLLESMNMKEKMSFETTTDIPSEEELMRFQSYVSELTKEHNKRFNKYRSLRKILEHLFAELERKPNTDFEKHLLTEKPENFILSDYHMKSLFPLHSELESCYKQNNNKIKEMKKNLESLWDKSEVQQSHRDLFYRNINGCKPSMLALLEEEILKFEELERQNIKLSVIKVRKVLNDWYEKCLISDHQKNTFRLFLESNEFSEKLLDFHEKEVQRMEEYHKECKDIFVQLEEWNQLWERLKELDSKTNDPNRFNNRGAALILEERDKKLIQRKLPKIETNLKMFSDKRFKEKGQYFEVFGIPVKQYLEDIKMKYQDIKEYETRERQRLKLIKPKNYLKSKWEPKGQTMNRRLSRSCGDLNNLNLIS